jgi:hypothetical protein
MNSCNGRGWLSKATLLAIAATGLFAASAVMREMRSAADDVVDPRAPAREHPAYGTRFWVEVIESFNAKYDSGSTR